MLKDTITLARIKNGADATQKYRIEANVGEVGVVYSGESGSLQITNFKFFPENLEVQVYKNEDNSHVLKPITLQYKMIGKEYINLEIDSNSTGFKLDNIFANKFEPVSEIQNLVLLRVFFEEDDKTYETTIPVSPQMPSAASLIIGSQGIEGAYRENKLKFDGKGLTIYGAGIRIKNALEEEVFYANEDGNLTITGAITATSGNISGKLEIGEKGTITGADGAFSIAKTGIIANNITIQKEASIEDYIKLGNSYLYNPDSASSPNRAVLSSGGIVLQDNNYLKIGGIEVFGGVPQIRLAYASDAEDLYQITTKNTTELQPEVIYNPEVKVVYTEIKGSKTLYFFKEQIDNKETELQFFYNEGNAFDQDQDGKNISDEYPIYKITNVQYDANNNPTFSRSKTISTKYKGRRLLKEQSSYLQGGNNGQSNWKICDDGTAYFKDITANKVRLQETVLEIGTVQSVGSLMLFKDSWMVENIDKYDGKDYWFFETKPNLSVNDWVQINGEALTQITDIKEVTINSKIYHLVSIPDLKKGDIVIKFGNPNNDFILSALGEAQSDKYGYAQGNSITISSFSSEGEGEGLKYAKRVVLGKLDGLGENISGMGLYADNVYLNGALTTKSGKGSEATYAGVNTLSGIKFTKVADDTSNIIFWAGAGSIDGPSIQKAPFQVTEKGTLYTQNAIIENSVFSGQIHSSEIHTAKIFGKGESGSAALQIYDLNNGIGFYKDKTEVLKLSAEAFSWRDKKFISFEADYAKFHSGKGTVYGDDSSLSLEADQLWLLGPVAIKGQSFSIWSTDSNVRMEYQQQINGYDLFVRAI